MCTDAYREALTRDLSSRASSGPAPTLASGQRQAAEAGREAIVGRSPRCPGQDDPESRGVAAAAAGAVATSGPARALAEEAMVVSGEVTGQR
jgi:hypothetical protein